MVKREKISIFLYFIGKKDRNGEGSQMKGIEIENTAISLPLQDPKLSFLSFHFPLDNKHHKPQGKQAFPSLLSSFLCISKYNTTYLRRVKRKE